MTAIQTHSAALAFDIEGQTVRCFQSGADRMWHCDCEYFQRMLAKHQEGFCPHVAVAIGQAALAGAIHTRGPNV